MNILITGAQGFIGSNLVWKLHKEHKVTALDFVRSATRNTPKGIDYVNADISEKIPTSLNSSPPDLVMHFATVNQEAVSRHPELESVNIKAMLNMLEYCKRLQVPLIFASSCSVYGPGVLHKETDALKPKSLYAVGKIACEEYARFYQRSCNFDVTILRFSNVYGDTTYIENKAYLGKKDVVRIFMEHALNDDPLPLIGGNQTRDFTFIDDAVDATCKVIGMSGFNIFNVGTGVETSIKELFSMIGAALIKRIRVMEAPRRPIDNITRRSLAITRISKLWKPKYSLNEGLKEYAHRMSDCREKYLQK